MIELNDALVTVFIGFVICAIWNLSKKFRKLNRPWSPRK